MFITSRESAISPSALSSDITPHKAGDAFRHGPSRNLSSALLLFSRGETYSAHVISVLRVGVSSGFFRFLPVFLAFYALVLLISLVTLPRYCASQSGTHHLVVVLMYC